MLSSVHKTQQCTEHLKKRELKNQNDFSKDSQVLEREKESKMVYNEYTFGTLSTHSSRVVISLWKMTYGQNKAYT